MFKLECKKCGSQKFGMTLEYYGDAEVKLKVYCFDCKNEIANTDTGNLLEVL